MNLKWWEPSGKNRSGGILQIEIESSNVLAPYISSSLSVYSPYDIPYRCLVSCDYDNLLAAGGTSSLDFITWGAIRYCTPSLTTGQAAGTAAALSVRDGVAPRKVDVGKVQKELNRQGMLTTNRQVAPEVVAEYARRAKEWGDGFRISE